MPTSSSMPAAATRSFRLAARDGAAYSKRESPAGILYFTRHYRLRDGQDEPPRDGTPGGGDLGYIKFGVFIADNRHFSVTLATPEIETDLRKVIVQAGNLRHDLPPDSRLRALDRSGPRGARQPGVLDGQSEERVAPFRQGRCAAGLGFLCDRRCRRCAPIRFMAAAAPPASRMRTSCATRSTQRPIRASAP